MIITMIVIIIKINWFNVIRNKHIKYTSSWICNCWCQSHYSVSCFAPCRCRACWYWPPLPKTTTSAGGEGEKPGDEGKQTQPGAGESYTSAHMYVSYRDLFTPLHSQPASYCATLPPHTHTPNALIVVYTKLSIIHLRTVQPTGKGLGLVTKGWLIWSPTSRENVGGLTIALLCPHIHSWGAIEQET